MGLPHNMVVNRDTAVIPPHLSDEGLDQCPEVPSGPVLAGLSPL
ncbi:MAG: hypothetical protein RLY31_1751 [Bacteroidota bacterium]|jgi:hypothetical protein